MLNLNLVKYVELGTENTYCNNYYLFSQSIHLLILPHRVTRHPEKPSFPNPLLINGKIKVNILF